MGFLDQSDNSFLEKAFDDSKRRDAIESSSKMRTFMAVAAMISSASAIVVLALFALRPTTSGAFVTACLLFAAVCQFLVFQRAHSDVRLLKVIERLKKQA